MVKKFKGTVGPYKGKNLYMGKGVKTGSGEDALDAGETITVDINEPKKTTPTTPKPKKVNSKEDAKKEKDTTPKKKSASNVGWKGGEDNDRYKRIARWKQSQSYHQKGRESKGPRSYSDINSSISTDMKKTPATFTPFKMKAKDYGNSPMKKNYGSFGTKHPEGPEKVGPNTPLRAKNKTMNDVVKEKHSDGESPAKFMTGIAGAGGVAQFWKKRHAQVRKGGLFGKLFGKGRMGKVAKHGDEAHHDGGAQGGEPQEPAFEPMAMDKFQGMDKDAKREYMGGLSPEDRKAQGAAFAGQAQAGMMMSDIRVKENIKRTGVSKSGIPTYEFNYIGDSNRYSGAMAQDLLHTDAVSKHESGYYMVDYNKIDVNMHLINN